MRLMTEDTSTISKHRRKEWSLMGEFPQVVVIDTVVYVLLDVKGSSLQLVVVQEKGSSSPHKRRR